MTQSDFENQYNKRMRFTAGYLDRDGYPVSGLIVQTLHSNSGKLIICLNDMYTRRLVEHITSITNTGIKW